MTDRKWQMKGAMMKIGISVILTEDSGNPGEIAKEAERLGFESFWVSDHPVIPAHYTTYYARSHDGSVPECYAHLADPFVALASAAQSTNHIRLGTGVCLLPERNIIATAKAAATLDLYSKGRLILGVGAGWFPEESEVMGVNFKRRWKHLREAVEALRELWGKDQASYHGEFIKFPLVRLFPKPVQKPFPPILLGAHEPRYALRRVVRFADGWCPAGLTPEQAKESISEAKRLALELGRDPQSLEFSIFFMTQGERLTAEIMEQYQEAGVSRLVVLAWAAASGSGVEAVKAFAPIVEHAQKIQ
jgi:probable F420-dependent oxidoreductase